MEVIQQFDESVVIFMNEFMKCGILDTIMPIVTSFGNHGTIWILLGIALICMGGNKRKWGIMLLSALLLNLIIGNYILKPAIARIRPFNKLMLDILIKKPLDLSFPSGHTTAAVTASVVMLKMNRRLGIAMSVFAFLMAFSRLYLLVHYPTDIIAGVVLGIAGAEVTVILMEKFVFKT